MKFGGKGNFRFSLLLCLICFLSMIFERQTTAFLFNPDYNTALDMMKEIRVFVLPLVFFCVANWSITTLMDGKGKMKEIFMVVFYAFTLLILIQVPLAVLTNFLSPEAATYVSLVNLFAYAWFGVLVFIGIQVIHEYTFGKMILTVILTAASIVIMMFICLLFFSLLQEIVGFAYTIYRELTLRV